MKNHFQKIEFKQYSYGSGMTSAETYQKSPHPLTGEGSRGDWSLKDTGWPKSASDKNFEILLKNYFLWKNFHNHRLCWNCPPPIAWHASNRRIIFWNTRLQVFSSMLCICASSSVFNSSSVVGLLRYTLFFKYAHKKKSGGVKLGLLAGHVPFDKIRSSKNSVRTSIVFLAVWA